MTLPSPSELLARYANPAHRRGILGELAAMAELRRRGWTIEAHRFRFGRHDLDLVARRGDLVAFIEVKTRRSTAYGAPVEAVGWRKRRIVELGAQWWRRQFGAPGDRYRFDVMAVEFGRGGSPEPVPRIVHVEDAWR